MLRHRRTSCKKKGQAEAEEAGAAAQEAEATRAQALADLVVEQGKELRRCRREIEELKAAGAAAGGGGGGAATNIVGGDVVQNNTRVEVHNHFEAPFDSGALARAVGRKLVRELASRAAAGGGGGGLRQAAALVAALVRELYGGAPAYVKNLREDKALVLCAGAGWQERDVGEVATEMGATAVGVAHEKAPGEERYHALLRALGSNGEALVSGSMRVSRAVLIGNKRVVMERLGGRQPRAGEEAGLELEAAPRPPEEVVAEAEAAERARRRAKKADAEEEARRRAKKADAEEEARQRAAWAAEAARREREKAEAWEEIKRRQAGAKVTW